MNKKFLKGVAALFAVAVLGVSCSNKDNTGPGTPQVPARDPLAVSLKTDDTDTGKLVADKLNQASGGNDKILEFHGTSDAWESSKDSVTIALEGADLGTLSSDYVFGGGNANGKTKRIKVVKVEGVVPTAYAQNTGFQSALEIDLSASGSFGSVTGDTATGYFTLSEDTGKLKIVPKTTLSAALKGANKLNAANNGGVLKITLEVSDVSNTKSPVELVIYFGVKRVKA